jgi:hypothetical protein
MLFGFTVYFHRNICARPIYYTKYIQRCIIKFQDCINFKKTTFKIEHIFNILQNNLLEMSHTFVLAHKIV